MANKKESLKSISKNEAKVKAMLLVIGMQNDKYRPACTFLPKDAENKAIVTAPELLLHVNRCIDVARAHEWKVVFALDLHHPRHVSFQKHAPHCVLQTWGSEMVKGLQFGFPNSDLVVRGVDLDQDSNDAFYVSTPGSPSHLRDLLGDIKTLYLCGASPDGCIEQTAQTASSLGYQPTILSDCSVLPLSVPILEG